MTHLYLKSAAPESLKMVWQFLFGRLRADSQYDVKFVCMSHNTIRGAAGGAVLMAELLCAKGFFD